MRVGGCVSNFLTLKYTNLFVFSSLNRNFALSLPSVMTNQGCFWMPIVNEKFDRKYE